MECNLSTPRDIREMLGKRPAHPILSVVIPAHNEERTIVATLASVAQAVQRVRIPTEVLCVCNACSDATPQIVQDSGVRMVEEPRKGVSYARQTGHEASEGLIVLMTDADSHVPETWINWHQSHYSTSRNVGVGGDVRYDRVHPIFSIYRACTGALHACLRMGEGIVGPARQPFFFSGANLSYRREAVDQVGGFEPGINVGEDILLGRKLQTVGNVVYDPFPGTTVLTSGRCFGTARLALRYILTRVPQRTQEYITGKELPKPRDFEDVR